MDKVDYSGKMSMLLEDGGTYVPLKANTSMHAQETYRDIYAAVTYQ